MTEAAPPKKPQASSRTIRRLAIVCLFLAGGVGLFSASEAMSMSQLAEHADELPERAAKLAPFPDPELAKSAFTAQVNALRPMRASHGTLLFALAVACAMTFVSAARILKPDGLPREATRRVLAGSTFSAALLCAATGAQNAVVASKVAQVIADWQLRIQPVQDAIEAQTFRQLVSVAYVGGVAVFALTVATGFLLLSQYFRSERVKQTLNAEDGERT